MDNHDDAEDRCGEDRPRGACTYVADGSVVGARRKQTPGDIRDSSVTAPASTCWVGVDPSESEREHRQGPGKSDISNCCQVER